MNNQAVVDGARKQALRVYRFIVRYKQRHDGCSPSVRQIVDRLALSSTSTVAYYLDMLEADGKIRRSDDSRSCNIEVVGGRWLAPGDGETKKAPEPD